MEDVPVVMFVCFFLFNFTSFLMCLSTFNAKAVGENNDVLFVVRVGCHGAQDTGDGLPVSNDPIAIRHKIGWKIMHLQAVNVNATQTIQRIKCIVAFVSAETIYSTLEVEWLPERLKTLMLRFKHTLMVAELPCKSPARPP